MLHFCEVNRVNKHSVTSTFSSSFSSIACRREAKEKVDVELFGDELRASLIAASLVVLILVNRGKLFAVKGREKRMHTH